MNDSLYYNTEETRKKDCFKTYFTLYVTIIDIRYYLNDGLSSLLPNFVRQWKVPKVIIYIPMFHDISVILVH